MINMDNMNSQWMSVLCAGTFVHTVRELTLVVSCLSAYLILTPWPQAHARTAGVLVKWHVI